MSRISAKFHKADGEDIPLDQDKLVRLHSLPILPLVALVVLDTKSLAIAVRVLQGGGDEILRNVDAPVVAEREGPIPRSVMNGSPEVDDLEAVLEELWHILCRQVSVDASCGRGSGLVNVDLRHRLTLLRTVVDLTGTATTDG